MDKFQAATKALDKKYYRIYQLLYNHHLTLKLLSWSFTSYVNIIHKYEAQYIQYNAQFGDVLSTLTVKQAAC